MNTPPTFFDCLEHDFSSPPTYTVTLIFNQAHLIWTDHVPRTTAPLQTSLCHCRTRPNFTLSFQSFILITLRYTLVYLYQNFKIPREHTRSILTEFKTKTPKLSGSHIYQCRNRRYRERSKLRFEC